MRLLTSSGGHPPRKSIPALMHLWESCRHKIGAKSNPSVEAYPLKRRIPDLSPRSKVILAGIPNLADHAGQNMQCTLKEFTVQTHTNACRVPVTVEDARPPRDRLKHTANRQLGTHST
jgi:hypothetical protein